MADGGARQCARPPASAQPCVFGDQPRDHGRNRLALGAGGEGQRHAVLEHRLGERRDVVERGRQAAVDQRAGAGGEHQRLRGARARSPADAAWSAPGRLRRDARRARDRGSPRRRARRSARGARGAAPPSGPRRSSPASAFASRVAGRLDQDAALGRAVGIADVDLQQEAVELRLGQRIGALLLERVLRRQNVERRAAGRAARRRP